FERHPRSRSAFPQRLGPRLEHGFEQVGQHALFAGDDVHRGDHAGDDQQRLLVAAQVAFLGAQLDQVEALAFFVGDGIGADQFEVGLEAAVDGEVVGGELDHGFLPRVEEGHVLRAYPGFDQQVVFQRDDLQQVAARLHHAADGVDLELFDDAVDRGDDGGTADPVLDGDAGGGDFL